MGTNKKRIIIEFYSKRSMSSPLIEQKLLKKWSKDRCPSMDEYKKWLNGNLGLKDSFTKRILNFLLDYKEGILAPDKCGETPECKYDFPKDITIEEVVMFMGKYAGWPFHFRSNSTSGILNLLKRESKKIPYTMTLYNDHSVYRHVEETDNLTYRFEYGNGRWILPDEYKKDTHMVWDYYHCIEYPTNLTFYFDLTAKDVGKLPHEFFQEFFNDLIDTLGMDWGYIEKEEDGEIVQIHNEKEYNRYQELCSQYDAWLETKKKKK